MNDCKSCGNYHDRKIGSGPRERAAPYGWCAAQSKYLESDPDRPEGAPTTRGPVAKPLIILPNDLKPNCPHRKAQ